MAVSPLLAFSHCGRHGGSGVRICSGFGEEGLALARDDWKCVFCVDAGNGVGGRDSSVAEIADEQCVRRDADVLFGGDGVGDGASEGWRRGLGEFGCDADVVGGWAW